jgi:hypothetical protein
MTIDVSIFFEFILEKIVLRAESEELQRRVKDITVENIRRRNWIIKQLLSVLN